MPFRRHVLLLLVLSWAARGSTLAAQDTARVATIFPTQPQPWTWGATMLVVAGHEGAARFQAPGDAGDQYSRVAAGIVERWQEPRGGAELALGADVTRYASISDLDQLNYSAALRTNRRLTPRVTASLDAAARRISTTELTAFTGAIGSAPRGDVLLPRAIAQLFDARAAVVMRLAERTTGNVEADYSRASYDVPLLVPGDATAARATLQQRLTPTQSLLVHADAVRGSAQGQQQNVNALSGGVEQRTGTVTTRVLLGFTLSSTDTRSALEPTGTAEISGPVWGGTGTARYLRDVSPAFGLGVLLVSDLVGARYDYRAPGGYDVATYVTRAWSRSTAIQGGRLVSSEGAAEVRRALSAGLLVGSALTLRRREQEQSPALQGVGARVFVGLAAGSP